VRNGCGASTSLAAAGNACTCSCSPCRTICTGTHDANTARAGSGLGRQAGTSWRTGDHNTAHRTGNAWNHCATGHNPRHADILDIARHHDARTIGNSTDGSGAGALQSLTVADHRIFCRITAAVGQATGSDDGRMSSRV